jgi:hypothetical protein
MTQTEIDKLDDFFLNDRINYKETIEGFLTEVEREITFKIKVLKASIQLLDKKPFAVIAFRRSKSYFFVEFYSTENIDNPRIIKTIKKSELIINRVNILSREQIDKELIHWIQKSKSIAVRN